MEQAASSAVLASRALILLNVFEQGVDDLLGDVAHLTRACDDFEVSDGLIQRVADVVELAQRGERIARLQ